MNDSPPSVLRGLRLSASAFADDIGRYALANTAWVTLLAATLGLSRRQPAALVLIVTAVPLAAGLGRMAARSVRGEHPHWTDFRDGLTHRAPMTWTLGASAIGVLAVAGVNTVVAAEHGGRLLVLSAVVSMHLAIVALGALTAIWPILMDPARDNQSSRTLVRQGVIVLALCPGQILSILIVDVVLALVQSSVLATAFVLPGVMFTTTSFVVLPRADHLAAQALRRAAPVAASVALGARSSP
jgi:hypothetical protein